jgi:hypothetical protein
VTSEVLDRVDRHPIVQDRLQEGVLAQFMGELYRYWPTTDDLAYLTGVGVAAPPGQDVTDDDQVRSRRTRWAFACRHCRQCIGGVGLEALTLSAVLVDSSASSLCIQLEAVDERDSRFGRKSTRETDHAEPVAPMAKMPGAQLLAMKLMDIGIGLAVLAGFVAKLAQV